MSPATAAQCSAKTGVSVVVDFNGGAGGGIQTACAPSGGGKYASAIFPSAGFPMEYVTGSGGFVCKVKSAPSSANCGQTAPENAYWGLFWAKPGASSWTYSTSGVGGLRVPEGGSVAWAFQNGGATDAPGVAPSKRAQATPTPTPTKAPPKSSGGSGTGGGTKSTGGTTSTTSTESSTSSSSSSSGGTSTASATPTPSAAARAKQKAAVKAAARAKASAKASASAAASPSASPSEEASAEATTKASSAFTPDEQDSGLPVWVPIAVILALGGAAGGVVWWRRRAGAA